VKIEWAFQLALFTNYSYSVVDGPDREEAYNKKTDFIIMNYDLLWRDEEILKEIKWDMVIADEIQRAKNFQTGTFKTLDQLQCNHRVGLTGTPLENDIMDLWTIMKFINPKIFGTDETSFKYRYCVTNDYNQIVPGKYRNLDEINKKLSFVMFRRKKRDVLDDLPEKVINNFYITLNPEERKIYEEVKSGILEDLEAGKVKMVHALAMITYLRQVCDCLNTVITKKKIISSKFEELKKIMKEIPKEDKVVIFTQYAKMATIIHENLGDKSVFLHGGIKNGCKYEKELEKKVRKDNKGKSNRELDILAHGARQDAICKSCPYYNDDSKCNTRKKIKAKFEDPDEGVKVFISTDAGKSGLNLQVANVIINYDLSFNPATNEQRIARVDRIGQKKKIFVLNLVCEDTIERRVLTVLARKQKLFDQVIDNMAESTVERMVLNHKSIKDLL
jgi:SNF2 family DNA or RNA helicase